MAHWLVKQEPTTYSWSHLVRDGRTRWDGVHNALALQYLRRMAVGDEAIFYHSGEERACIGILRVASAAVLDTADPRTSWYVEVTPVRPLARAVTLAELRGDPAFAETELLRFSRLSVMPFPERAWKKLLERAAAAPPESRPVMAGSKGRGKSPARPPRGAAHPRTR
jgi:predicted RNA-binding protein with PUA-like domain